MLASPLKRDPALLPVLATIWLSLALFVLYPIFRLFLATFLVDGQWSFANLAAVLNNWFDRQAFVNSLWLATTVSVAGTFLGYVYAFAVTRLPLPAWLKWTLGAVTTLPLISPPFTSSIALTRSHGPNGILLITGPTGSGKTTTLYASLNHLNRASRKILTVEDPVEYQFDGVVQVQVQPQIGRTFASVLRTFLRQDPNILMVGEVRDSETAQIAIQAALTGRLVLSTLHTNSAAAAIPRLLEMGCEDYLLASTINGIVGQRLVRRLCRQCREPHPMADAVAERLVPQAGAPAGARIFRAVGCARCGGTGFLGRTAILELLPLDGTLRRVMLARCDTEAIERAAVARGMETMYQNGVRQVLAGVTTIEEIVQATREG